MKSLKLVTMLGAMGVCMAAGAATIDGRSFESRAERNAAVEEAKVAQIAMDAQRQANFEAALPARVALVNSVIDQFRPEFAKDVDGITRLSQFAAQVHSMRSDVLKASRYARNVAGFVAQAEKILAQPNSTKAELGDQENLVFFAVGPCRIADSRFSSAGLLTTGVIRTYRNFSAGGQGGTAGCNQGSGGYTSGTPGSIAMNIAATSISGTGNLNVRPVGATSVSSSLNFQPGQDISNATVIKMTGLGGFDFEILPTVNGPGTIHVIIDLLGFYAPSEPAPLECVDTATTPGTTGTDPFFESSASAPACATGFTRVSMNCTENNDAILVDYSVQGNFCAYIPRATSATGFNVGARCCRVPGNSTGRF